MNQYNCAIPYPPTYRTRQNLNDAADKLFTLMDNTNEPIYLCHFTSTYLLYLQNLSDAADR